MNLFLSEWVAINLQASRDFTSISTFTPKVSAPLNSLPVGSVLVPGLQSKNWGHSKGDSAQTARRKTAWGHHDRPQGLVAIALPLALSVGMKSTQCSKTRNSISFTISWHLLILLYWYGGEFRQCLIKPTTMPKHVRVANFLHIVSVITKNVV